MLRQLKLSLIEYNDLSVLNNTYDIISYLNSALILLFMFSIVNHLSYWIEDFKLISHSLQTVILLIKQLINI